MKGQEGKLVEYMEGAKRRFVIPVYQRNYDWKIENCKQLYDDLIKVIRHGSKNHFFGCIVSVNNPDGNSIESEYLIIDGQQRVTTISLIFLAMCNLIDEGKVKPKDEQLKTKIFEEYLIDKYQPKEKRVKLKSVKNDNLAFSRLFEKTERRIEDSKITINYNYFYERIAIEEITIDELYEAINKLTIINITLNNDDNPQLIFESLNSTGLDLSEGDKIRNYVLMGLRTSIQEDFYEKYWNKIEERTQYNVSDFIRDYLSVKQQRIPNKDKVYAVFKDYVESKNFNIEDLLKDLLVYAKRYEILLTGNILSKSLGDCIKRLNLIEFSVARPFFLEVIRLYDEDKLDISEVDEIFSTIESYWFRRAMCNLETNILNKVFVILHKDIISRDGTESNYVEKFKYILLSRKERSRFPEDKDFIEEFRNTSIYTSMRRKNIIYILERFNNFNTKETQDIYKAVEDRKYSIEHIMPQTLTPKWKKSLGEDWEEIHEDWCNCVANLTLTAYNSKYSNLTFKEKKEMQNGFEESGIRLNNYIAKNEIWGLQELKNRENYLMRQAKEIWKFPETLYKEEGEKEDSASLGDEDIDFTGKKIYRYEFKGEKFSISSWGEMYESVVKQLFLNNELVLRDLSFTSKILSNDASILRKSKKISNEIYLELNNNTETKLSNLRLLFARCGEDPDDLIFYTEQEDEEDK